MNREYTIKLLQTAQTSVKVLSTKKFGDVACMVYHIDYDNDSVTCIRMEAMRKVYSGEMTQEEILKNPDSYIVLAVSDISDIRE